MNVATLAALGALLLGMGEQSTFLPVLAATAALTSVIVTDVFKWFRFHQNLATLAAFGAVLFALRDFLRQDSAFQLVAIANLLIYLQVVLLFQEKNVRVYWQLIILSLLQVVVAAALNLGLGFGLLLIAYMFVALSALLLLFVFEETRRFQGDAAASAEIDLLPGKDVRGEQWSSQFGSHAPGNRPDDPAEIVVRPGLIRQVLVMGLATLAVAVVVFFAVPRYGNFAGQVLSRRQPQVVGFSPEISLDKKDREIWQSGELVLQATFSSLDGDSYDVQGEPYFRGAVLSTYDSASWTAEAHDDSRWKALSGETSGGDPVRQTIELWPTRADANGTIRRVLFNVAPLSRIEGVSPSLIRHNPLTEEAFADNRTPQIPATVYKYAVRTSGFYQGRQVPLIPAAAPDGDVRQARLLQLPTSDSPEQDPLAYLKQLAEQIVLDAGVAGGDSLAQANALQSHFHDPNNEYVYSLDSSDVARTRGSDPVEDFVRPGHRTGHCEYFASALVLMLRSRGIPARVVMGYRTNEYNWVGDYYQVRAWHAHAWAEAYLRREEIPADMRVPGQTYADGAWLRLDATPASALGEDEQGITLLDRVGDLIDYAQLLWNNYVAQLDSERQQEAIYRPIADRVSQAFHGVLSVESWQAFVRNATRWISGGPRRWFAGNWFNWRAGLTASLSCLVFVGIYRLAKRIVRWMVALARRRPKRIRARRGRRVDFYQRLETILARLRLSREAGQTQREYAASVGGQLAESPRWRHVASLPKKIVEAFYRVRFGDRTLDNQQAQAVEQALAQLEAALKAKPAAQGQQDG